jgi:hypothetical protein
MRIHRLPCPASAMQAEARSHDVVALEAVPLGTAEREGQQRIEAIERLKRGLYSH